MDIFIKIVGGVVILTACAGCLWAFFAGGCSVIEWMLRSHRNAVWYETRENIVRRFTCDAWWFSEDPKTMRALQLYAEMLVTGFGSVSDVREKWRKEFPAPVAGKGEHG